VETFRTPNRYGQKKTTSLYNIIKIPKPENKEWKLKVAIEKFQLTYKVKYTRSP
jgi:hypothetical protein